MFKMMKVFECERMPNNLKESFRSCFSDEEHAWVQFHLTERPHGTFEGSGEDELRAWLIEEGAYPGDTVLIRRDPC